MNDKFDNIMGVILYFGFCVVAAYGGFCYMRACPFQGIDDAQFVIAFIATIGGTYGLFDGVRSIIKGLLRLN